MVAIPKNLEFRLYSHLTDREKTDSLRQFLNAFSMEFGSGSISRFGGGSISNKGSWRRRLDFLYKSMSSNTFQRDTLITYINRIPVSVQQFYIPSNARSGYAEGIFVDKNFRRRGIARVTREMLFAYLIGRGIEIFYVGKSGNGVCARVRKDNLSQELAEADIRHSPQAIVELERTAKRRFISSYGINLARYRFTYQNAHTRARSLG